MKRLRSIIPLVLILAAAVPLSGLPRREGPSRRKTVSLAEAEYGFPVQVEGHFEYIDPEGRFIEGLKTLTPVDFGKEVLRAGLTFFDRNNQKLFEEDYDNAKDFSEGLAPVRRHNLWGYIDLAGKTVIPEQFDDANEFSEGFASVRLHGKFGYIDRTGTMVIPPAYDLAMPFKEGMAAVALSRKDEYRQSWGYIDTKGTVVIPIMYEVASDFSEGYAAVTDLDERPSHTGRFLDKQGRHCFPEYYAAAPFTEGLALVGIDNAAGYINTKGELVIKPRSYCGIVPFAEGMAAVRFFLSENSGNSGPWGYIDRTGEMVIQPRFFFPAEFSHGLAWVEELLPHEAIDYDDVHTHIRGYINRQGEYLWKTVEDLAACREVQEATRR